MRIIKKLVIISLCSILSYVEFASGQNTSTSADPILSGLAKDTIAVHIYGDDLFVLVESHKISEHHEFLKYLQEIVIERIARAGIKVTNFEMIYRKVTHPRFYVGISLSDPVTNQNSYGYAFTVIVGLTQQVVLTRDKNIKTSSMTWQRWSVGFASKENIYFAIIEMIEEKTDEFIIEFLKANKGN